MHSGGANTTLKNNRKLLKKRKTMFRRSGAVRSTTGENNSQEKSQDRLVTLSASERKAIGRKLRIRRRIESGIIVVVICGLLWWIFA